MIHTCIKYKRMPFIRGRGGNISRHTRNAQTVNTLLILPICKKFICLGRFNQFFFFFAVFVMSGQSINVQKCKQKIKKSLFLYISNNLAYLEKYSISAFAPNVRKTPYIMSYLFTVTQQRRTIYIYYIYL